MTEQVNHPSHYNSGPKNADGTAVYEAIKVIEAVGAGFCFGNALKYISRAAYKGTPRQDLEKALWYLDRGSDNTGNGGPGPGPHLIGDEPPYTEFTGEDVAAAWGLDVGLTEVIKIMINEGDGQRAGALLQTYLSK